MVIKPLTIPALLHDSLVDHDPQFKIFQGMIDKVTSNDNHMIIP